MVKLVVFLAMFMLGDKPYNNKSSDKSVWSNMLMLPNPRIRDVLSFPTW